MTNGLPDNDAAAASDETFSFSKFEKLETLDPDGSRTGSSVGSIRAKVEKWIGLGPKLK